MVAFGEFPVQRVVQFSGIYGKVDTEQIVRLLGVSGLEG